MTSAPDDDGPAVAASASHSRPASSSTPADTASSSSPASLSSPSTGLTGEQRLTFAFPTAPSVPLPTAPHAWLAAFSGRLLQGTCGWTDASILRGHHFYPPHVHTAVERLRHYSSFFPCVEVDSSNYAVPPPSRVASWLAVTPPGFLFHFKVFGLFTSLAVRADALPGPLRPQLPAAIAAAAAPVRLDLLPASYIDSLWQYWNTAILPAHAACKLGLVIFQFQLSFTPSDANRQHVEWCRERLCSAYRMGVEFRDRSWLAGQEKERTLGWLAALDLTYIVCDDLEQETYRPGRELLGLGEDNQLPVVHATTASHSLYVRLHRRTGDSRGDRVLAPREFAQWAERLRAEQEAADASQQRPVFFMWGTDCIDDPITNARRLGEAVKEAASSLWLDWRALRKEGQRQQGGGNILALFSRQEKRNRDQLLHHEHKHDEAKHEEENTTRETAEGREHATAATSECERHAAAESGSLSAAGRKDDAASRKKRRTDSDQSDEQPSRDELATAQTKGGATE